ncbi:MAG: ABC transporter permease [Actinomycetales bacterium]|nr:ABC transporter permease [Actinomycetales bacterium]
MSQQEKAKNALPGFLPTRFRDLGIGAIVVFVAVAFGVAQPNFFRPENLSAIVVSISIVVVMAIGQMFVIVTRQIDLSIGSILGLSAMVMAMVARDFPDTPVVILALIAIVVGALCGVLNGALVTLAGVPPIIATLGTLALFRGLIFVISDNTQVNPSEIPAQVSDIARPGVFGIPPLVLIAILVALAGWYFASRTMAGLRLFAVGSNSEAAQARGLNPGRVSFWVFVLMGALAGLAGLLYVSRFATVNPADVGFGWELTVISAVVIGGTNIFGGSGSVPGVVLGCLLVGVLANGLTVVGISGFWQQAAEGAIILIAVVIDTMVRRQSLKAQSIKRSSK